MVKQLDFSHGDTNSWKLKVLLKNIGVGEVKKWVAAL